MKSLSTYIGWSVVYRWFEFSHLPHWTRARMTLDRLWRLKSSTIFTTVTRLDRVLSRSDWYWYFVCTSWSKWWRMKPRQSHRWSREVKIERLPARVTLGSSKYPSAASLFLSAGLEVPGELEAEAKSMAIRVATLALIHVDSCSRYTDLDVALIL